MSGAASPARRGLTARNVLAVLLGLEVALAGAMVWLDISSLEFGSGAPGRAAPLEPGDQRRPWRPEGAPAPPPGMTAFPEGEGLVFETRAAGGFETVLRLSGPIAPGDAARFAAALTDAPYQAVMLHSPGGVLGEALEIGRAVRAAGLAALVAEGEACVSACPTVLFGGTERIVSRGAFIGMHQSVLIDVTMITTRTAVAEVQRLQGEIIAFTREMGVDPGVHAFALRTPAAEVYYLLPEEIEEYRVATRLTD